MMKNDTLKPTPPALLPPQIVDTESSSSSKSHNRRWAGAHVQFPSSAAEGAPRTQFPGVIRRFQSSKQK